MKGNLQNAPPPLPPVVYVRQGVVGSTVETVVVAGSQEVAEEKSCSDELFIMTKQTLNNKQL